MIIWGKRTYGAVNKVGNVSVQTVFGHLYFLPLIPMTSYYIQAKTDAAFELNGIDWRSVLCGYVRVFLPIVSLLSFLVFNNAEPGEGMLALALCILTAAIVIASYVLDMKFVNPESAQVRLLMQQHFGLALDPFECLNSMQNEIDARMQAHTNVPLEHSWYKRTLGDLMATPESRELALLRARCDQHDAELQKSALGQTALHKH